MYNMWLGGIIPKVVLNRGHTAFVRKGGTVILTGWASRDLPLGLVVFLCNSKINSTG